MKSRYNLSPETRFVKPLWWWTRFGSRQRQRWGKEQIVVGAGRSKRGLVVDFGKEIGGYLRVHWGDVKGRGDVCFYFSESLEYLEPAGDILWQPFVSQMPLFCQHRYCGRGKSVWRDSLLRGGFRYLLIVPSAGTRAEIRDIVVEIDFYLPEQGDYHGFFESSDSSLNRIWYSAAYTMQVATKHSWESFVYGREQVGRGEWVIFDGAKRDRAVWSLDLSVCIPSYLLSLGNREAVRDSLWTLCSLKGKAGFSLRKGYIPHGAFPLSRAIGVIGSCQTFAVYLLWWIRGVCAYYLYTGDKVFANAMFEDIIAGLRWFQAQTRPSPRSGTPLFFADGFNDFSWDYTLMRRGFSGATNVVWLKTLEEVAWLSAQINREKRKAVQFKKQALAIRKALFEKGFRPYDLWDDKLGRFRYTTRVDVPLTLEVNALALLYDVAQGEQAEALLDLLARRLHRSWGSLSSEKPFRWVVSGRHNAKVMPCLVAFEVAALAQRGRLDEAVDLTKRTWLPMLKQGNGTTFWEWYGDAGKPPGSFASLCHPWSASILQVLTESLSGVSPASPGYASCLISPFLLDQCQKVNEVKFVIPTPRGEIIGSWHRARRGILYEVSLPSGVEGKISPTLKKKKARKVDREKVRGGGYRFTLWM